MSQDTHKIIKYVSPVTMMVMSVSNLVLSTLPRFRVVWSMRVLRSSRKFWLVCAITFRSYLDCLSASCASLVQIICNPSRPTYRNWLKWLPMVKSPPKSRQTNQSQKQWRIQDFPEVGAPTLGGATYDFAKFSQKLHEIERIWTRGGDASKILLCRCATEKSWNFVSQCEHILVHGRQLKVDLTPIKCYSQKLFGLIDRSHWSVGIDSKD